MMSKSTFLAAVLIATCAYVIGAQAENVYKCGNTYSQVPCPGGKVVNVEDARDPQQKLQQDAATQRDAALAKEMEKTRLANEAALHAAETKRPVIHKPKPAAAEPTVVFIKPKRPKPHATKPKDFTALTPGSAHPPAKKRSVKKPDPDRDPG